MSELIWANAATIPVVDVPEKLPTVRRWRYRMSLIGSLPLRESIIIGSEVLRNRFPVDAERPITFRPRGYKHPLTLHGNVADLSTLWEVVNHGEYDLPLELEEHINGQPIIDVGANIGLASAMFASRYPNSTVVSIEPHPRNFSLLEQNVRPYGLHMVPLNGAFSLSPEPVPLLNPEAKDKNYHARYHFDDEPLAEGDIAAVAVTPESILAMLSPSPYSRIGLLKVDIEGAETKIFNSPRIDSLLSATDILAIETHDRYVPGASVAVASATRRNGMSRFGGSPRGTTHFFGSPQIVELLNHSKHSY